MHAYVALLRGINLGKRRLKMERLRELFEAMGFSKVETFIASGNVVFEARESDSRKLEARIELHLGKALGYGVDTFVRTRTEIEAAASHIAFPKADPDHTIHAGFLKEALSPAQKKAFLDCATLEDEFYVLGRDFYWLCRIRTADSKVWSSPQMRALRIPTMTMRNLKSLKKLSALHPPA